MVIELQRERARKQAGSAVIPCPVCGNPLSFRDEEPFCRTKGCPFADWYAGVELRHRSYAELSECMRRR